MEDIKSLEDLLDLQAIDSDIDRLLDRRANLAELAAYRAAHEELAGIETNAADVGARLRDIERATDKSDGELQIEEEKAHREEQRLYAGGLSARDAEFLRAEVEMLRRRISEREDELLALLDEKSALEETGRELGSEIEAVSAEKDRIEEVVAASWKEIDADVARLEERKAELVRLIDGEMLEVYEAIRPVKEGVAIARLGEGVCGGCHLALSAAEQVKAAKDHPPRCVHCRRILVLQ